MIHRLYRAWIKAEKRMTRVTGNIYDNLDWKSLINKYGGIK